MGKNKERIILIGRSTAGKTTLCQRINHQDLKYHKTQTVQLFSESMIDTPGEYLEYRAYRGALLVSSADADTILFVQDATADGSMFSPAYASMFAKPVVGVITKCDLADEGQIEDAKNHLRIAGAQRIFETSSVSGGGIDALMKYLKLT